MAAECNIANINAHIIDPPLTMSAGPSNQAGTSSQASISDAELEKLLNREASAFQRELEVNRILKAFKLK